MLQPSLTVALIKSLQLPISLRKTTSTFNTTFRYDCKREPRPIEVKQVNDEKGEEIATIKETKEDISTFIYGGGVDATQLSLYSNTH